MEFTQKKLSNKSTFTFQDDYFNFACEDKSGATDYDIHYGDVPQKSSLLIEQNEWLRNVGLLWIAIGLFEFGYALYAGNSLSGKGFWFFIGICCTTWALFTKVKYTVFKCQEGSVYVIRNKQHDEIIAEITRRRKAQLLQWYGEVNPDNDLENEIKKFKWLVEQGAMSVEASEQKIAEAEFHERETSSFETSKLN